MRKLSTKRSIVTLVRKCSRYFLIFIKIIGHNSLEISVNTRLIRKERNDNMGNKLLQNQWLEYYAEEAIASIDNAYDETRYNSWFMEEGSAQESLFVRLKNAVIKFFKGIADKFNELFKKKEIQDVLDNKDIDKNMKIQLSKKNEELISEGNITLKELDKCKTADDVDKAMTKYRNKKKIIKVAVGTVVVTAGAAMGYIHHKKNKEMKQYKADQEKMIKELEQAQREAANERTLRVQEANAARDKQEALYAKVNATQKELDNLRRRNKTAASRGHTDSVIEITKAKIEIKKDQAVATNNAIVEAATKIQEDPSVKNVAKTIANTRADIAESKHDVATQKVAVLRERYNQLKKKGIKLKSTTDGMIGIISSKTASAEDKKKAWAWIEKNEPKLYYAQSRAGHTRRSTEKIQNAADRSYIKSLGQTGYQRIKSGSGRKTAASQTSHKK